jgi:putative transposase
MSRIRGFRHWRWHLHEMYVKLNGEMVYLWRAVDHEGEVLESYVTRTRDKAAALTFMKKALKRHGSPEAITTDGLRSYGAAMDDLGNREKQEVGRWANNRVENSHLPIRRREWAMLRFRQMKTLQKFASVHANVHNHSALNAASSIDRPTRNDAQLHWLGGRFSQSRPTRSKPVLRRVESGSRWTDSTDRCITARTACVVVALP